MSLSARIAVEPSRHVAWAELLIPLFGSLVAGATLCVRWPAHRVEVLVAIGLCAAWASGFGFRRLRIAREALRLTISDRAELDVLSTDATIDGVFRLVESTVVWSGFWILALERDGGGRVRHLAFEPSELPLEARRPLARFLIWSKRTRGGRSGIVEKSFD
jgi:hypothetical protein